MVSETLRSFLLRNPVQVGPEVPLPVPVFLVVCSRHDAIEELQVVGPCLGRCVCVCVCVCGEEGLRDSFLDLSRAQKILPIITTYQFQKVQTP